MGLEDWESMTNDSNRRNRMTHPICPECGSPVYGGLKIDIMLELLLDYLADRLSHCQGGRFFRL